MKIEKVKTKIASVNFHVAILLTLCCLCTNPTADAGTTFPGNSPPHTTISQSTTNRTPSPYPIIGTAEKESGFCQGKPEGSSTEGLALTNSCARVSSFVNLFSRQYQDGITDMSVKAPGGYLNVHRLHSSGRWHFEHEFDSLNLSNLANGVIKKSYLSYRKGPDGLFHYKTFTLADTGDHYRWENPEGDYILFSKRGLLLESGSRYSAFARYHYEEDQLRSINDRNDSPVFLFDYGPNGKIRTARDMNNRQITYIWEGNNLLSVTDWLGNATNYSYSPQNQLITKTDKDGRKVFITYHPDGAVKTVLTQEGEGSTFSYDSTEKVNGYYARVTTTSGKVTEFWFDSKGEAIKTSENGIVNKDRD